jgi:type IV pilus assembly protein PilA
MIWIFGGNMKAFWKTLKRQDGFTLVELMVVVAIIGLLSAVAIPNFKKYQAKSKTSEAKLQLAAIYTAMQSWYSDYDNYASCLTQMGYDPSPEYASRYFAVGFAAATYAINAASVNNGAPAACVDATTVTGNATAAEAGGFGAGKMINNNNILAADYTNGNLGAVTAVASGSFLAGALGPVDSAFSADNTAAAFTVNQNKLISIIRQGY